MKAALLRLRCLTPYYSIEAWLFQNTVEAERLCRLSCGRHVERIRAWAADRGALDELEGEDQPKGRLPCVATYKYYLSALGRTAITMGIKLKELVLIPELTRALA